VLVDCSKMTAAAWPSNGSYLLHSPNRGARAGSSAAGSVPTPGWDAETDREDAGPAQEVTCFSPRSLHGRRVKSYELVNTKDDESTTTVRFMLRRGAPPLLPLRA
jgi:hypothetical protein